MTTQPAETGTGRPGRAPGRPRQADVEPRCYAAVLELFGQHGWAGLSLDAVANHAGIGKSAIYLRWKSKRDLLLEAVRYFETRRENPVENGQPLREYLIEYCIARGRLLLGPHGPTMLHIVAGAITHREDFQEIRRESITRGTLPIAARILRAVIHGELPRDTDSGQLLDMIEGALVFHLVIAPLGATRDELEADLERYVTTLIDKALHTVGVANCLARRPSPQDEAGTGTETRPHRDLL